MNGFSRIAVAAVLVASFGGVAHARSQSLRAAPGQGEYYALSDRGTVDHPAHLSGTVPPSLSGTVMGLRVPR